MTDRPMMMCGHTANAQRQVMGGDPTPVCAVCFTGAPGDPATVVNTEYVAPGPERLMRCSYSTDGSAKHMPTGGQYAGQWFDSTRPSNPQAAFFKAQPDKPEDSFYCGCWGWD